MPRVQANSFLTRYPWPFTTANVAQPLQHLPLLHNIIYYCYFDKINRQLVQPVAFATSVTTIAP